MLTPRGLLAEVACLDERGIPRSESVDSAPERREDRAWISERTAGLPAEHIPDALPADDDGHSKTDDSSEDNSILCREGRTRGVRMYLYIAVPSHHAAKMDGDVHAA